MKKLYLIITIILSIVVNVFAQSPQSFRYQTVVRDASGITLSNKDVSFRISILQDETTGINLYTETHHVTTNFFGLVNFDIGTGEYVSGGFSNITWGQSTHYIQIEMDIDGGNSYQLMGTSKLVSVPYSLHAKEAGYINGFNELRDSVALVYLELDDDSAFLKALIDENAIEIQNETIERINNDNALNSMITIETNARISHDENIREEMDADSTYLKGLIDYNTAEISLISLQQQIDSAFFKGLIDQNTAAIAAETITRSIEDQLIRQKLFADSVFLKTLIDQNIIDIVNINTELDVDSAYFQQQIDNNTTNITNLGIEMDADSAFLKGLIDINTADIVTETNNRIDADNALQDSIDMEEARRIVADQLLVTEIDDDSTFLKGLIDDNTNNIANINIELDADSMYFQQQIDNNTTNITNLGVEMDADSAFLKGLIDINTADIVTETNNRIDADNALQDSIDMEEARRIVADQLLVTEIDDDSTFLKGLIDDNTNNIANINIELDADSMYFQQQIDNNTTNITNLGVEMDADSAFLKGLIDINTADIVTETNNRIDADNALQDSIDMEEARRIVADQLLVTEIDDDSTFLKGLIDDNTNNIANINIELDADSMYFQQQIDNNTTNITNLGIEMDADSAFLKGLIDINTADIVTETNNRIDADNALQDSIDMEEARRIAADLALQDSIDAETAARLAAGYLTTEVDGVIGNEFQALSISNDTLYLTDGGFVKLPSGGTTSLDQAYDAGGAGAGREIIANTGAVLITGTDGLISTGTFGSGSSLSISGSGARMIWYPRKAAFRVGYALSGYWDNTNIGEYSFASGYATVASGNYSTSMGTGSMAFGDQSTAIGYFTKAHGKNSITIGSDSRTIGDYSIAIGVNTKANGKNSTAMGFGSNSNGEYSIAMGYETYASGKYSFAIGNATNAAGQYSTAMGYNTSANGRFSISTGYSTNAKAAYSTVFGRFNIVDGNSFNWVDSDPLFAIGNGTSSSNRSNAFTILKNGRVGIGVHNPDTELEIDGQIKITGGSPGNGKILTSDADGLASWINPTVVIPNTLDQAYDEGGNGAGREIVADNGAVIVSGTDGIISTGSYGSGTTLSVTGYGARMIWYPKKASFRAGYAYSNFWDNTNIGIYSFASGYGTIASGKHSTAMGYLSDATGDYSTALGNSDASGAYSMAMGYEVVASAAKSTILGCYNVIEGDPVNWVETDPVFAIGNGTAWNDRRNAFTILKNGKVGIGVHDPDTELEIDGQIKIRGGSPGNGKILTSDAGGLASWQPLTISNNTLNQAYDEGGNGAGKEIVADNGAVLVSGTDGIISTGTYSTGATLSVSGEGTRMIWFPKKAAFRAGYVHSDEWNGTNIGGYSFAGGYGTRASGNSSFAIGFYTNASGFSSIAMGANTTASHLYSVAMGNQTEASGWTSTAMGEKTIASSYFSTAMGNMTKATGSTSTAMGYFSEASGRHSMATGSSTVAQAAYSMVTGSYNLIAGNSTSWVDTDPLFVIGNGSSDANRSNAITVLKNGNLGIGYNAPTYKLAVKGSARIKDNLDVDGCLYVSGFFNSGSQSYNYLGGPSYGWPHTGNRTGPASYSIFADESIMAHEFHANSDRRIKTGFILSSGKEDLNMINNIEVTNYKHIDSISKGNQVKKGLIAQQVEEVCPRAVSKSIAFIPDIYIKSTEVILDTSNMSLIISIPKNHDLDKGDKIKLYNETKEFKEDILEVISDNQFRIAIIDGEYSELFIFGKEVNDFRSIDYDQVFTAGIGAIQELSRQNEKLRKEIGNLKDENSQLKASTKKTQNRLKIIERSLGISDKSEDESYIHSK